MECVFATCQGLRSGTGADEPGKSPTNGGLEDIFIIVSDAPTMPRPAAPAGAGVPPRRWADVVAGGRWPWGECRESRRRGIDQPRRRDPEPPRRRPRRPRDGILRARGCRLRALQARDRPGEQRPRDHHALDLARPLADLPQLRVAHVALDRVVAHVAV